MATIAEICRNPLNLRSSASFWLGQVGQYKGFAKFESNYYGIRAAMLNLRNYFLKGLNTPRGIINRWAPPVENDTKAYIDYVCKALNMNPDDKILTFYEFVDLVVAMAKMESGFGDSMVIHYVFHTLYFAGEFKNMELVRVSKSVIYDRIPWKQ